MYSNLSAIIEQSRYGTWVGMLFGTGKNTGIHHVVFSVDCGSFGACLEGICHEAERLS